MTTDVPTIDVPRLRKELEYITAHRAQWKQGTWIERTACGTVGCLAGNAVINAGYRPIYAPRGRLSDHVIRETTRLVRDDDEHTLGVSVRDAATKLFGLTNDQAVELFGGSHTLRSIWECASQLTNGEIEVPLEVIEEDEDGTYAITGADVTRTNNYVAEWLRREATVRRYGRIFNDLRPGTQA